MAGQRQQSQSGFGNQYYPRSGQKNRVSNYNSQQAQPDEKDEYGQACSFVSQQLRAQIGGQCPVWDGPIPGFWDRQPGPPPQTAQQQQQQSHAMSQQNQLRWPAKTFGQDQRQQRQQQSMDVNEASHFLHAQEHFPASQLHKGVGGESGRGLGGHTGGGGGASRSILPSMGMQQQAAGQHNRQPYQNNNNTQHQMSATMTMPGPKNSIEPRQPPGIGTFGQGSRHNQLAGYAPGQQNNRQPSHHNNNKNKKNTTNHQSATLTMPGPDSFAPPGQPAGGTLGQGGRHYHQPGCAPVPSNGAPMYPSRTTNRGGNS